MTELKERNSLDRRSRRGRVLLGLLLTALVLLALLALWLFRDRFWSPQMIYRQAQEAEPKRAAVFYRRLAEEQPQIEEYARLWAAERAMPDMEAMRALEEIIAFRPQSPAAYLAHIAVARYYASIEAPAAEDAYRAALDLEDTVALRLELAHYLEERGDAGGAYDEYRRVLRQQADAFAGMRRTGADPLSTAEDLIAATYYSDAVETLRGVEDPRALPLRARALAGLGHNEEAVESYRAWLKGTPDDEAARLGLARALARLGRTKEALSLYKAVDTPDSALARAELLEEDDPDQALALYVDSPYPVAWWSATTMLEAQGRITETLPLYARLARSNTYLADDAAYRLYVLAGREGDEAYLAQAEALLDGLGLNWFALRATGEEPNLDLAPPLGTAGEEVLAVARALSDIGWEDLAHMELVFAARFRDAPEVDLAMAQKLAGQGDVVESQAIAQAFVDGHPRAPLAFWQLSYPRPYSATVQSAADEFGVDPLLMWAVMRAESLYDPQALSYVGARGLMQIMPSTQEWIAEQLGEEISPGDAYTLEPNLRMGAWFLRFLLDHFDGDLELAVAAYNGGAGSVDIWLQDPMVSDRDDLLRWIGYGETREYVARVMLNYQVYRELYAEG